MNYNHPYVDYQRSNSEGYNGRPPAYAKSGNNLQETGQKSAQPAAAYTQQRYSCNANDNAHYQLTHAEYPPPPSSTYPSQPMVLIPQQSSMHSLESSPSMPAPTNYLSNHFYDQIPPLQHYQRPLPHPQPQPQAQALPPPLWASYSEYNSREQAQGSTYATNYTSRSPSATLQATLQSQHEMLEMQAMVGISMQPPRHPRSFAQVQPSSDRRPTELIPTIPPMPYSSGQTTKTVVPPAMPQVDYQQLLLLLAEEYINTAYGMGSLVAFYRRNEDLKQYYTLMAMGLSCIETSLTQFRLAPPVEASVVLQYCNLVFRETENYDLIDKWLSKTIPLCERNRLLDIKYSMHHLSARTLFATRPRVAIKSLDAAIPSAQGYEHIPWVYALRFLRVSFTFKLDMSSQDLAVGVQNLHAISELASEQDDAAVSLICATYTALLHLRSMSANCVEEAQSAVAAAKSLQFHTLAQNLNQIWALLDCVEVICYLMEGNPAMAAQKAEQMAPMMDEIRASPNVDDDGLLLIPLNGEPSSLTDNASGIFRRVDGRDYLVFQWLPQRDFWAFCYLLNGIAAQARTFANQKADAYLREGLKIMKENLSESSLSRADILAASKSLSGTIERFDWWHGMRWFFNIYMVTNACSQADWAKAHEFLVEAQDCPSISSLNDAGSRAKWETFLYATILQGRGQIEEALTMFQSPILQLPATIAHKSHNIETDLSLLAVLNGVLITLDPTHPAHSNAALFHELVSHLLMNHPNKSLRAAHDLLRSVLNPHDKLIDKKKHFAKCLNAARAVSNTQLVSIALSLMCTMFFKDVVGEQAQKSVKSARALADRSGSMLWKSVAAGLQEQTAVRHGNEAEGRKAREDGENFIDALPDAVKRKFTVES